MKKSKKKEKKLYNSKESLVVDPIPTPEVKERKMIKRKEVQAEIDIDKSIRRLLRMEYYNHNQIASMIRGANLERVKQVDNERRKT